MRDFKQILLDNTEYGGETAPGSKAVSASQFNAPLLQRWLRYKYGVPKSEEIGVNTIGSLVHLAIEGIIGKLGSSVNAEVSMEKEFPNGWKLTGTADIIDRRASIIYDIKMIKKYRTVKLKEAIKKNAYWQDDYIVQLNILRYLAEWDTVKTYDMRVMALQPDAGFDFKTGMDIPVYEEIEIPRINDHEIEEKFHRLINELLLFLNADKVPEKCEDVWPRKVKGTTIAVRCKTYCSYRDLCPRYNVNPLTAANAMDF